MPSHYCVDPHDPYAQQEVLVEFTGGPADIKLLSAIDASMADILDDLEHTQCQDLILEIAADYGPYRCAHGVRPT